MLRLERTYGRFLCPSFVAAVAALLGLSVVCGMELTQPAMAMTSRRDLSQLPLTFPVQSSEIAAYFNQIARPEDIASFPPAFTDLLPQVTAGQRMPGFASWADAERELEGLIVQIDMVMYNPEHWEQTPASEQQNLAATVQRAAEFAHAHGIQFMFAPDRRFAEDHLGQVAPYVDAILLQGQRLQDDPQAFASWVRDMSSIARASNPEVQIYAQVGATRGTAPQMFAAIQSVSDEIDGIAVWSMPPTLDILKEFVTLLRESTPATQATPLGAEATPASTSTPIPATTLPIETTVATPAAQQTIVETYLPTVVPTGQTQAPQAEAHAQMGGVLKEIALIAGGIVIGLLLGAGLARRRKGR